MSGWSGAQYTPGPVVFDYDFWAATYPELASSVNSVQAQGYFNQACIYLNNTGCSPVLDNSPGGIRATLLGMLTAHIAALFAVLNGNPSPTIVGRITNASEGSVSVAATLDQQPGTLAWYNQTKYGVAYLAASAPFRMMRYQPGPQPYLGVGNPWGGGAWYGPT